MSKIKLLIVFIFFSFLVIFSVNGQNTTLERKVSEIDSLMYAYKGKIALPIIDSLLEKKLPINRELHLKAFKIQALVQIQKLETALNLSNEILENPSLKGVPLIKTYLKRALIYELARELKESERALDFVRDYYKNSNASKDELYGEYLYRQSSLHLAQGLNDKGYEFAKRAVEFGQKYKYPDVEATGLALFEALKPSINTSEKIRLRKKIIVLRNKHNNNYNVSFSYFNLSKYYYDSREYNISSQYLDSAIYFGKKANNLFILTDGYKLRSEIFEKRSNLKEALRTSKLSNDYRENHYLELIKLNVSEINAKFNFEKEAIKNEALVKNLTNEKEQKSYLLIGIIILVTLLSSLIFLSMNLSRRRKEIKSKNIDLSDALDKNKLLLRELNHRVNNNLALILSLVKFQYYEIDEPKYKDKFQSLEHRIKTIAAAHEQLLYNKENIEGEEYDVQEYLSKITNALIDISTKNIQLNLEAKNINLNIDTMLPIGILTNELMSNSIKHAVFNGTLIIDIQANIEKPNISITYKDSGSTFKEIKSTKSLGVSIINSMVKQLRGTIERKDSEYKISLQLKNIKNRNE